MPSMHSRDLMILARSAHLPRQEFERDVVIRPRDGSKGNIISVYTSENMMLRPLNRTRVGALRFSDREDRDEFIHSLLTRIGNAKGNRREHFGFEVRSCTFVVDGGALWVVFIGLAALSYGKWHKLFLRLGASEIKVPCIHVGTQTSLETVADMFEGVSDIEQLLHHQIVCEVDEDALRKVRGKRKQPPGTSGAKTSEPTEKRVRASEPAEKTSLASNLVEKTAVTSELAMEISSRADKSVVDECLAFLTSAELPSVENHHAFLLQHIRASVMHNQIGLYLLSHWPVELYAQVVQLQTVVVRVLGDQYFIDARDSLDTASLVYSGRFWSSDRQLALLTTE